MSTAFLGIDLGTTNSAAALFDGQTTQLVRTASGGLLTPSVVRIDSRGGIVVGDKARRFLDADPSNTRAEFKRLMGTAETLEFPGAKLHKLPQELAAEVLRSIRNDVREQVGFDPDQAVITVPALFELPQAMATSEAARLAGFAKVELVNEPVAAALAAGWSHDSPQAEGAWMVYDLGGGTFDVSLLETREGLLRIVGHDGDNFLGGRDIDLALLDRLGQKLVEAGEISQDAAQDFAARLPAAGLVRCKRAIEEAKIELSRAARASVFLAGVSYGERSLDLELDLTLEDIAAAYKPVIERSVAICRRLLAQHGLSPEQVHKMVLVGGPTVMPLLRQGLQAALSAPAEVGLDPMALVAQGAAIYAATMKLPCRLSSLAPPSGTSASPAHQVWLQHPNVTSDLTPYVLGKVVALAPSLPAPEQVALTPVGAANQVLAEAVIAPLAQDRSFMAMVKLAPRATTRFRIEGVVGEGDAASRIACTPAELTIIHGVTLGDPPLSRSIGISTAANAVKVYFERGTALPAKRSFRLQTVEHVQAGDAHSQLRVPIVQGEFAQAHLCRLIGMIELTGAMISTSIAPGTALEVALDLDKGGRLAARAHVLPDGPMVEHVASLLVGLATPAELAAHVERLQREIADAQREAFRHQEASVLASLAEAQTLMQTAQNGLARATGGDADATLRTSRALQDCEGLLEDVRGARALPELVEEAEDLVVWATSWIADYGTPHEKRMLNEVAGKLLRARDAKRMRDMAMGIQKVRTMGHEAFMRSPNAWALMFESAASRVHECRDLPRANALVEEGWRHHANGARSDLERITRALWNLMPPNEAERVQGYHSGVRQ